MQYPALAFAFLAACRFNFDPRLADDARGGDTGVSDVVTGDVASDVVAIDANTSQLVQAVSFDAATGGFTINAINGGLATVTSGNMVLVVCGHPFATGQCLPTSTPPATWQQIDGGTSLGVYVTCNAPAINSITIQNGNNDVGVVVTEWRGVVTANCLDASRISNPCPTPPGNWTSLASGTVTQNRELIISAGMASDVNAGITVDAPFVMARNATGVASTATVYTAFHSVDAAPTTYTATGTIQRSQAGLACFNDVFAFKAL